MGTNTKNHFPVRPVLMGLWFFLFLFSAGQSFAIEFDESVTISPSQLDAIIDPQLKAYKIEKRLLKPLQRAETIKSEGSETISKRLVYVAQGFNEFHKNIAIRFRAQGSAKAVTALAHMKTQLAPMSRPMSSKEEAVFVSKLGYPPTPIIVAHDAVAVFVQEKNPLVGLPLETIARIFSQQKPHDQILTWGQLSLRGQWKNRKIVIYGRNRDSGTRSFFRERVLKGNAYRKDIREMPGNRAVVQGVVGGLFKDPNGIGYASIAYNMKGVRPLQLAKDTNSPILDPNYYNIQKGFYPLCRPFYIYINKTPGKPSNPVVEAFIRFILSRNGQILLAKGGVIPLSADDIKTQLKQLAP